MKNIEKVKNYQKKLYAALSRNWEERFFSNAWHLTMMGAEWDKLFEMGLIEKDFCSLCGNDELKSGYYKAPAFSKYNVKLPVCDVCWDELGVDKHLESLQEAKNEINNKIKSGFLIAAVVIAVILYLIFK